MCVLQIRIPQICLFKVGVIQICPSKVSPVKVYVPEKATLPIKASQIHFVFVKVFECATAASPLGIHN
jgi:hypothetical protein